MSKQKNITILVAGRPYPLKINISEEHDIRRIAKEINEKLNRFQLTYENKDKQDCLSMSLLTYAVELHRNKRDQSNEEVSSKLSSIETMLDHLID